MLAPADERRHAPGDEQMWNESWYFDVVAPDASWGMYARLGLYPNTRTAWWWAAVVREGEPLLLVRDHTLRPPKAGSFEVRGDALWADLTCHEPMQRWQVNFEGVAVALEDPTEAYRSEHGHRTAVEFEFEWEAVAPPFEYPGVARYEQSCVVHGEVQVAGGSTLAFDDPVPGQRDHSWGMRDWWSSPWVWSGGRLEDGTRLRAGDGDIRDVTTGDDGLPSTTVICIEGVDVTATPRLTGGVAIEAPDGRVGLLHRAAATFAAADGRTGVGWMEWNLPPAS